MEDHLRGIPVTDPTTGKQVIDPDTNMPKYTPFDANQDNTLSEEEHTAAVLSITTMLANNPEYADSFNPEAFSLGYGSALDEEKIAKDEAAADIAGEKWNIYLRDQEMQEITWQQSQEDRLTEALNESGDEALKVENLKEAQVREQILTIQSDFLKDSTNPDKKSRKYFHGKIDKEQAATPKYALTMETQDRLRKLYARAMEMDLENIGLPTLQRIAEGAGAGGLANMDWGIKPGETLGFQYGNADEEITQKEYAKLMTPVVLKGKEYTARRDAIINIVRNPDIPTDKIEKILRIADKYSKDMKQTDNQGTKIDMNQLGVDYMTMLNNMMANVNNDAQFSRFYDEALKFLK